jgi:hypothetical protein
MHLLKKQKTRQTRTASCLPLTSATFEFNRAQAQKTPALPSFPAWRIRVRSRHRRACECIIDSEAASHHCTNYSTATPAAAYARETTAHQPRSASSHTAAAAAAAAAALSSSRGGGRSSSKSTAAVNDAPAPRLFVKAEKGVENEDEVGVGGAVTFGVEGP